MQKNQLNVAAGSHIREKSPTSLGFSRSTTGRQPASHIDLCDSCCSLL